MQARVQEQGLVPRGKVNNARQVMLPRRFFSRRGWGGVVGRGGAAVELVAWAMALAGMKGRAHPARGARIDLIPLLCL